MTLDHVGIAVDSPAAMALFERLLAATPYKVETVRREGVSTTFFGDGGQAGAAPKLELLEALADDTPVGQFLAKRGPGLHHLAFEVPDLDAEMQRVRALGLRLLAEHPRPGADGKQIVFLHPKDTGGVLVELCQSVRAAPQRVDVPYQSSHLSAWISGPADAPPLVVLHGALGSTRLETDRLIRHWEARFRVVGIDLEGHGASGDVPGETEAPRTPDWHAYVDNVRAVLDALHLPPASLFGFSMGGGVALAAALAMPGRFTRLAVHGVNVQWSDAEVEPMIGPMEPARLRRDHPFWAQRLEDTHGPRWPALADRIARFTRRLPDDRLEDAHLATLQVPVWISHGDRDRFFALEHPLHLLRVLPDARLSVLPGVDHPIQSLDATDLARRIEAFFTPSRAAAP